MNNHNDAAANHSPPRAEDYLPAAIQKAVIRAGLKHPATVYPIALGLSAAVVGLLFNSPMALGAGIGLGLVGPLWAVLQIFFRHDVLGSKYLDTLHRHQQRYEAHLADRVETELRWCSETKDLDARALTGIAQLKSIRVKLENVKALLDMKLRPGEITYGRFLGAAEQVSLSVLDNLNIVAGLLKSAASIEPDYIQARLKVIHEKTAPSREDEDQRLSLQQRRDLWISQLQKADHLMARNEEAMTEMERISAAVAQWRTGRKFAGGDLESAIKRLHALAVQAHEYDNL